MHDLVLPGDELVLSNNDKYHKVKMIGCGYGRYDDGAKKKLIVSYAGIKMENEGIHWIDGHFKNYSSLYEDKVIGMVTSVSGEAAKVDIKFSKEISISLISFEGATKSSRQNLVVGDLLFGSVKVTSKHVDPELVCIDDSGRARGLGVLPVSGLVFDCSTRLSRRLLSQDNELLKLLGAELRFEITCGVNGRIWIDAASVKEIIAIYHIIQDSEFIVNSDISGFVKRRLKSLRHSLEKDVVSEFIN